MVKIAAYTIAKNESKHVHRWLQANAGADVRVILDTGSTDNTVELLREAEKTDPNLYVYTTIINPFRFDDARNTALALVPVDVDVCMSVDMDEIPDPDFYDIVRKQWKPNTTRGWHWFDTGSVWRVNRLHSRWHYRWTSPCHEVAGWYGDGEEVEQIFETSMVHKPDETKSRSQYLNLLVMAVNEKPDDPRMWTYLAREYYFENNWPKVLETSAVAVALEDGWNVERAYACRLAGYAAEATGHDPLPLLLEGLKHDSESLESWFPIAHTYYRKEQWKECWDAASKRLKLKPTTHYLHDQEVWDWKMYDLMAISKWHLGDRKAAIKYAEMALRGCPDNERLQKNLEWIKANEFAPKANPS